MRGCSSTTTSASLTSTLASSTATTANIATLPTVDPSTVASPTAPNSTMGGSSTPSISASVTQVGGDDSTPTNATAGVAIATPSTAQPFEDNTALVGGIVGGVVALLLLGGVVAFLVAHSRRRGSGAALHSICQSKSSNDTRDEGASSHRSNYESLTSRPPESRYGVPPQINCANKYATPSSNRPTEYEHGDIAKVH
jgi:uncharacterized membrane protein